MESAEPVELHDVADLAESAERVVERVVSEYVDLFPDNRTNTFASFSCEGYELSLGAQVTVMGSKDDFLVALRDRLSSDPDLLRRYDDCKLRAAPLGATEYWKAKDEFLRAVLDDSPSEVI